MAPVQCFMQPQLGPHWGDATSSRAYCSHHVTTPRMPTHPSVRSPPAGPDGLLPDYSQLHGSCIRTYQIGSWFLPCFHSQKECAERLQLERAVGKADLRHIVSVGPWNFTLCPKC